jgi:hypothetical protein
VIEVYPAATLIAAGVTIKRGGKDEEDVDEAKRQWLLRACKVPQDAFDKARDPNVRDAIICAIAGVRFLEGRASPPIDVDLSMKEGWIWV